MTTQKQSAPFTPTQIYMRLLKSVRPYRFMFGLAILGNILYAVVDGALIKLLEPLLDKGLTNHDAMFIQWIPFIIIGMFVLRGIANFLSTYCMGWVGRRVVMNFRQVMFKHLLGLPTSFYDKKTSGELLSKITFDVEQVAGASTDAFEVVVRESCTALALIAVMLSVSWRMTFLFMVLVPLMAFLMSNMAKRLRRVSSNVQRSMGGVNHIAEEAIEGAKVVKIFGGQAYEADRFDQITHNNRQQEMKLISTSAITTPLIQLVGSIALAGAIYFATLSPDNSFNTSLTPGEFATLIMAMMGLLKPIKQLTKVNSTIQRGIAGAMSIFEFLDEPLENDNGKKTILRAKGNVSFKHVNFGYDSERLILNDVSFEVAKGQTVAFVGRSGGGKTTLVHLLARFYDIQSGEILIDDHNICDLTLANLRAQISFVSQHVTLFNDTIFANIVYGLDRQVTQEEVEAVAESAHALEFIQQMPMGLYTVVGENGVRLSGGQRQRLAIARAMLKQAPILILDEATSALDTESERKIQAALDKLMRSCTTLVIAHRLSTIENADKIIVMEKGRVLEEGNHSTLMQKGGIYANLRHLQFENHDKSGPSDVQHTDECLPSVEHIEVNKDVIS